MTKQTIEPRSTGQTIVWLLLEQSVYALFVLAYYLVVLHLMRGWLKELFDDHKSLYAIVALGVIIAQAVLLELVTAGLYKLTRGKVK